MIIFWSQDKGPESIYSKERNYKIKIRKKKINLKGK